MRDLGKQRHLLLSLPLSCAAGQNPGRAQAGGGEIQEELEQKQIESVKKGKRKGWVRRKQLNDNVY